MAYFDPAYFDSSYFDTGGSPVVGGLGSRVDMVGQLLGTFQLVDSGSGNTTTLNNVSGLGAVAANLICAQAAGTDARFAKGAANSTFGMPIVADADMIPICAGFLTNTALSGISVWNNGTLNLAAYKMPRIANEY